MWRRFKNFGIFYKIPVKSAFRRILVAFSAKKADTRAP
jgi:hypothetical protein